LDESASVSSGGTPSLYYALAIMEWVLYQSDNNTQEFSEGSQPLAGAGRLVSKAAPQPSASANLFSPAVTLKYAEAHFELWSRKGVAAEDYHLHRARQLYELAFKRSTQLLTPAAQFAYCKVLSLLGDFEAASTVALRILATCDHDADYPNYLFYTGGIFKAMGDPEKANNYFFEASQVGPPKLFSKLEMMMIISRTIEEAAADDDTEEEGAFKMVRHIVALYHMHLHRDLPSHPL
jgi:tetratricopeptide (TPR) repeat protein